MNNDTKRNTDSILTVRSIGSSYHDVDYLFSSNKDNSTTRTYSSDITSDGIFSRCSNYVYNFFKGKNKDIKSFLLDQKFVSGIGNIYASEILFLSKINPFKKVKLLSKKECQKIITNSRKILLKAISKGGSSIRDFKDTSGLKGGFQNEFKVYQQEGVQCKNIGCSDFIKKKIISNRSTFFCDSCQK